LQFDNADLTLNKQLQTFKGVFMKSKKTNKAKTETTKTKDNAKKHKKLKPAQLKIIKGGQERPTHRALN